MYTFSEFRTVIHNRDKNRGISRKDMPQIKSKHYDDFFEYIKNEGGRTTKKTVNPKKLKPTQTQFSDQGVVKSLKKIRDNNDSKKEIIISRDNYVMDGHHRWIAHTNAGKPINVIQIDMDSERLLKMMKSYNKVGFKDIYDNKHGNR